MQKSRRRRRAGRSRKDGAKRRKTTTVERAPATDLGSPELLYRKLRAAGGSTTPVEITDAPGIMAAHDLITPEELALLRRLAGWLRLFGIAYGLRDASVSGLWNALLAGGGDPPGRRSPAPTTATRSATRHCLG
jgi:hypothetical protein